MRIAIDAFGGDNAPLEVIKGSRRAADELGVDIILVGDEEKIKSVSSENNISLEKIEIKHTTEVFDIHDDSTLIIKEKKNTSMAVGLKMLADGESDAFVSAGSTGALVVGSTFIAKRLKGIKRAALAPILPSQNGFYMLLDAGANVDCRPDMLVQFAIMGSCYAEKILGIKNPRVGLINVGAEETKGRELELSTYKLLEEAPINFKGNAEARDVPLGEFDVVVADGFTGNVFLKSVEGMGAFFSNSLKDMLMKNGKPTIPAIMLNKKIKVFKKKIDYKEQGGAVLMGISKPVIKAHGSSDAKAFFNAIRQAKLCVEQKVIESISESLEILENKSKTEQV